jgi:hypothetical protein
MGGGSSVKQTNAAQATAANAGATAAANNSTALSQQYNTQQQQQYNNLFGANGKGGAVGSLLDPSKLNVTSPTGVYALQKTGADQVAAQQYGQNAANITSQAQQSGFGPGTPSGFVQDQQNKNARSLADTRGTNFGTSVSNQYNDALSNFWKAAGMSQSQGTAAQGGALQGNNTAASTYGNLYGTAGQGHVVENSNVLGNLIGAAGTIGGAAAGNACMAKGTKIRVGGQLLAKVEDLRIGDTVLGVEGKIAIIQQPEKSEQECVTLTTEAGHELVCSLPHTLLRPLGGYVRACESLGVEVLIWAGKDRIVNVQPAGVLPVYKLVLNGSHTYLSNNLWSEE